ncbi:MAG: class I SAM-dependent methyltransferase [Candidatus Pacebacteria bacterium]|nr:class I SAM-dependent methyltransferase [Candidatus Paceibacterota bacterium]
MHIEHWDVDAEVKKEAQENYRTKFALSLAGKDALTIVRELTFDGVAPLITIDDLDCLLRWIEKYLLRKNFSGVGVEVGAGPLVFSSVLARCTAVTKMYGIEICQPIVEQLFPGVARGIAQENTSKLVGVVGSFDDMQLPDASVDFVFDFFSLHHSLDIEVTFREIARVLKPGGFLLMLDKARPDSYSQDDLDALLDTRYGPEYNKQFGIPAEQVMTRRLNGEREYRRRDWWGAAYNAGIRVFESWRIEKPDSGGVIGKIKLALSILPPNIQLLLSRFIPQRKQTHKFILDDSSRVFTRHMEHFRKEMSVMIAYKNERT